MSSKKKIHVMPRARGWAVVIEGSVRASAVRKTKAEATEAAKKIASRYVVEIVIHSETGKFRSTFVGPVSSVDSHQSRFPEFVKKPAKTTALGLKKAALWREWAAHRKGRKTYLSDDAISRETIYGEHG